MRHRAILGRLIERYPNAGCELEYSTPFELLVAVMLSSQCTDKRVNLVTKELFKELSTPQDYMRASQEVLEKKIYSCGFYHNKAKNIIAASRDIVNKHGGQVPDTMQELTALCGVGRKTANVVLSEAFGENVIAVDTHVFRVSRRLGLAKSDTPEMVERELATLFETNLKSVHHALIFHGRYCCHSKNPDCKGCCVNDLCTTNNK